MSRTRSGVWEGLGGPVHVDRPDFSGIDPTLDACCRREAESNRRHSKLQQTLQRHDVTQLAERRRRHLVQGLSWGIGCRCCYDPNSDGGEYRALIEAREKLRQEGEPEEEEEEEHDSEEEDSDDEFDYLLDEDLPGDDALKEMEERRKAELELLMLHQEAAQWHGYGTHRQLHPTRVLKGAGLGNKNTMRAPPLGVVLHLVDPDSSASASLDLYLERLAETYKGTKFVRSGGRSTLLMDADFSAQVLPRLRPDSDLPALVAIREGVVVNVCPNLVGLVDERHVEDVQVIPGAVRDWLDKAGVLLERMPPFEELCGVRPEEEALYDHLAAAQKQVQEPPRYDCGIPTCCKPFFHEHVGVQNQQQEGLVVPEEQVIPENGPSS